MMERGGRPQTTPQSGRKNSDRCKHDIASGDVVPRDHTPSPPRTGQAIWASGLCTKKGTNPLPNVPASFCVAIGQGSVPFFGQSWVSEKNEQPTDRAGHDRGALDGLLQAGDHRGTISGISRGFAQKRGLTPLLHVHTSFWSQRGRGLSPFL